MNSGETNEFEANYNARVAKIRKAAAIALKELDRLRLAGPVTQEAFDAEVARITQEKLHPHGCDLVVHRTDDGIARFLIKVQSTGRKYDLIKSFFHRDDGSPLAAEVWLMTLDLKGKKVVVIGGKHSSSAPLLKQSRTKKLMWWSGCVNGMMTAMKRKCFQ
jgi:hypothetical protein